MVQRTLAYKNMKVCCVCLLILLSLLKRARFSPVKKVTAEMFLYLLSAGTVRYCLLIFYFHFPVCERLAAVSQLVPTATSPKNPYNTY